MSTTKRGSDKIAAPPCYAGEPMVEERFFPRLGRSIKVYPADFGSFTKNEEVLKNQRITPRHQSSSSPSFMSTMKPGSDLGEKKAAPPCYAGEPVVEERFFPRLGRSIKVYPADFGSFTKNEEYRDGSPRVLYESGAIGWVNPNKSVQSRSHHMESRKKMGFCGANPRKSVISRSSHIQNTKKVSVGRLRSGCKVHYLRRRLASPSVPNKFLFSPSSHALEICFPHEPVLSNSATPQTITAPSPFPFKLIDSPANLSPPCVSTEPRFKFTEWREASPFPGRTFKIRKLYDTQNMGNMTVVKSGGNLTSLPPRGILYERSCIEAKTKKSEGLDDEKTFSSLASCIDEITKHVELLKQELAKPYTSRQADLLFSWIPKTGALPPYKQVSGECWAAALQRGRAYYMAANGIKGKELTIKGLLNGVSRKHLNRSGGLVEFEGAKEFLVANGYVRDLIVHRRPVDADADELACYESLIEKLLAKGAVVVVYNTLPGYDDYKGKGIYIPEEKICEVASYEKFKQHSVVVTGCGVGLVEEKLIEFWQTHDSQGPEWGVDGFGQLARRNGLIVAAIQFEFDQVPPKDK